VAHESFAAASTILTEVVIRLYHHGKLVKVIQLPKKSKNDVVTKPTIARGNWLLYSEDDEYLNNVDEDDDEDKYEDNNFSSVHPDDVVSRNCILDIPQWPDTSKMSKREEELALDNYKKKRKLYTDAKRMEKAKQLAEADITTLPQRH
jgi:hypothetical protein